MQGLSSRFPPKNAGKKWERRDLGTLSTSLSETDRLSRLKIRKRFDKLCLIDIYDFVLNHKYKFSPNTQIEYELGH